MKPLKVVALHGFLGKGSDWDAVHSEVAKHMDCHWTTPNLFSSECELDLSSFSAWVQSFAACYADADIFLGYSFGGRLILEVLKHREKKCKAVLVSAHPGLFSSEAKAARIENDHQWAQRFLKEPTRRVLEDWDQQDVFAGTTRPNRVADLPQLSPDRLAMALENLSLGHQTQQTEVFTQHHVQVLVGERDRKFRSIYNELPKGPETVVVPQAGHRVLLDNPVAVATALVNAAKI